MCANASTCLQSHGREVDEEGWNSSNADSEGVQRSAHSTPHAHTTLHAAQPSGPFGPSARVDGEGKEQLQVTSRSRSAFIPRRLKQVLPLPLVSSLSVPQYITTLLRHPDVQRHTRQCI